MSNLHSEEREAWSAKLASHNIDDQIEALRQISSQDSVSGLSVPIVGLAGSSDDEVRMWSAEALESAIQPEPSEVFLLMRLLQSAADGEICYWSATMLGRLGRDAAAAAAVLEKFLRESSYLPARERATWALSQIGPAAVVAREALRQAAETAPPRLQRLATGTLEIVQKFDESADGDNAAEEAAA